MMTRARFSGNGRLAFLLRAGRTARRVWQETLALALPPTCIVCEKTLAATEPVGVCPACYAILPTWDLSTHPLPPLADEISAFHTPFLYEDPVPDLVGRFKFADQTHLARPLARLLLPTLKRFPEEAILVPVPMHVARLRRRRFNQAGLLAKALAKESGRVWLPAALARHKKTPPQVGRSAAQRRKALQGAFQADAAQVKGKELILVDDVFTTGSTAAACAKALKKAGAASVQVLTIAYVSPQGAYAAAELGEETKENNEATAREAVAHRF